VRGGRARTFNAAYCIVLYSFILRILAGKVLHRILYGRWSLPRPGGRGPGRGRRQFLYRVVFLHLKNLRPRGSESYSLRKMQAPSPRGERAGVRANLQPFSHAAYAGRKYFSARTANDTPGPRPCTAMVQDVRKPRANSKTGPLKSPIPISPLRLCRAESLASHPSRADQPDGRCPQAPTRRVDRW
jgi:hypothetical protein